MRQANDQRKDQDSLASKNRMVAIMLGLLAFSIYAGYILAFYL